MNEVDSFDLNDVHLAAPHTRFLVQATQKKANIIARQTQEIHQAISSVYHAQVTLTESYRNLSSVLRSTASGCAELSEPGEQYKQFNFQFVSVMDEIIELHQAMCTDLQSSVLDRLQEYVDFFSGLPYLANSVEICDKSRDQAFHTFMKLPKKTNLKTLQTALLELATFRREYERTATMYYGYLNQAERLREIIPLLTMIGFLERYAQHMKTMAKLTSSEMAVTLLELIQSTLQRKLDDESTMSTRFTNRADELRFESLSKFCSDPWLLTPDMSGDLHPNIAPQPNRKLQSKCGRLLMRTRVNLVWRWVEVFCHTQAGSLMSQQYGEIGASLLVDLSQKGVYTEAVDCDDRRNVFQIVSPTLNKMVILQAESQLDRDEWIYTLTNVIFDVNSWEARRLSGDAVGGASTLKVSHATPPPACAPCSTDAWYFTCLPPVCFTLPTLPELTASRDAELLQVHCLSSAPPTSVTQESGPSGSQPRNDELLMVEKEDIMDPLLDLGFLGSLELPQNFGEINKGTLRLHRNDAL
ncbi:hypothetical protein P879_01443 [Paragonimus westermani]|uniref:PH domain-containing protein n=1 Tax=Paragonimus westermani TaxID=34504 RepID=A0A8T0DNR4_9TREM|nr:hypothetical protein P879_01443 [Paragonimus westermani]